MKGAVWVQGRDGLGRGIAEEAVRKETSKN